jgi:succinyl-CoA synthetase beta subunit
MHGRSVANRAGPDRRSRQAGRTKILGGLYEAFLGTDASQIEINPLAVCPTPEGQAVRARRQGRLRFERDVPPQGSQAELRDLTEEDPAEVEASEYDLAYIKLDGNIGCMVNGAGLAMATMDIIKLNGEFPANFLDVGGGANKEKVTAAFKIILKDPA